MYFDNYLFQSEMSVNNGIIKNISRECGHKNGIRSIEQLTALLQKNRYIEKRTNDVR